MYTLCYSPYLSDGSKINAILQVRKLRCLCCSSPSLAPAFSQAPHPKELNCFVFYSTCSHPHVYFLVLPPNLPACVGHLTFPGSGSSLPILGITDPMATQNPDDICQLLLQLDVAMSPNYGRWLLSGSEIHNIQVGLLKGKSIPSLSLFFFFFLLWLEWKKVMMGTAATILGYEIETTCGGLQRKNTEGGLEQFWLHRGELPNQSGPLYEGEKMSALFQVTVEFGLCCFSRTDTLTNTLLMKSKRPAILHSD